MKKLITINLSYFNQSKKCLMRHISSWRQIPLETREQFTFIIIDDHSAVPAYKLISKNNVTGLDFHLYRVKDNLVCNISGVRNLGARECKTDYMVILDMDTLISPALARSLIELANKYIDEAAAFKFNRIVPNNSEHCKNNSVHPAVCLIRKKDYWDVGGCEEDLVGHYGWTDISFWFRARGKINVMECRELDLLHYVDGEANIDRNREHNKRIYDSKTRSKKWSTDSIRFKWEKQELLSDHTGA